MVAVISVFRCVVSMTVNSTVQTGSNADKVPVEYYYVSPSNEGRHIVLVLIFSSASTSSASSQRRSHEGHYGTRHTTLWSCTHIQNIIDLS